MGFTRAIVASLCASLRVTVKNGIVTGCGTVVIAYDRFCQHINVRCRRKGNRHKPENWDELPIRDNRKISGGKRTQRSVSGAALGMFVY